MYAYGSDADAVEEAPHSGKLVQGIIVCSDKGCVVLHSHQVIVNPLLDLVEFDFTFCCGDCEVVFIVFICFNVQPVLK